MSAILAPSLGYTGRAYKPRKGERFDVGNGRMLTVRQITLETGLDPSTIYARLAKGELGQDLVRPLRRKLFDCGNGERLTVKEIMLRTGLAETAVRSRISRGVKGKALLAKGRKDAAAPRSSTMVIACRLADAYPDRLPTTKEVRAIYPMCAQSAERWLTALRDARQRARHCPHNT